MLFLSDILASFVCFAAGTISILGLGMIITRCICLLKLMLTSKPIIKRKMSDSRCPLPPSLITWLAKRKVIEMCAGNGENSRKIKEEGGDIITFDIQPEGSDVMFGKAGTVEHEYSNRTLLLCMALMAEESVTAFQESGGKQVICGGVIDNVRPSGAYEVYHTISDIKACKTGRVVTALRNVENSGESFIVLDSLQVRNLTRIDVRPSVSWMIERGWKLERTIFGTSGLNGTIELESETEEEIDRMMSPAIGITARYIFYVWTLDS